MSNKVEATYHDRFDHRFDAIQDELLELRDARISILPAPNGLVACERDGTPSSIVRLRIPDILRIADQADREDGIRRCVWSQEESSWQPV